MGVFPQIGDLEALLARLSSTHNVPGAAQLEILLGQIKAILTFSQRIQPMLAGLTDARLEHQKAATGQTASPYPTAQLVQLRGILQRAMKMVKDSWEAL